MDIVVTCCGLLCVDLVDGGLSSSYQGRQVLILDRRKLDALGRELQIELLGLMTVRLQGGRTGVRWKDTTIYYEWKEGALHIGLYAYKERRFLNCFLLANCKPERFKQATSS